VGGGSNIGEDGTSDNVAVPVKKAAFGRSFSLKRGASVSNDRRGKKEKGPPPPPGPGPPTEKKKARSGGTDKRSRWESDEEEDSEDEERAKILRERKQDRRQKRKLDEEGGAGDDARSTTPTTQSHTHTHSTMKRVSWRGVIDDLVMYDERDMVGVIHRDIYKGSEGSSVLELLRRQVSEIMYVCMYVCVYVYASFRSDGGKGER
jgi:hypothetical protein